MHRTAMMNAQRFMNCYGQRIPQTDEPALIVEVGSQDVNGSLKQVVPPRFQYIGVDFAEAKGVDIVLDDPYSLPFESESVDAIMSSSVFEHSEMFWLTYLEILRVLKPSGLFYLNVPSNGFFHRYPVDCWRFYPDSGNALVTWAQRNGLNPLLLESYTSRQYTGARGAEVWNDFVAIFVKDADLAYHYPDRITTTFKDFDNGSAYGNPAAMNATIYPEDIRKLYGY